jgi:UDP-N-acetylglucosamine 4,6-dehydratase
MNLLVTGGTGTFGHAFIPAALESGLFDRIAIYSRDEDKQFRMRRDMQDDQRLRWFIGDVRDYDRLRLALRGVDCVVHAAALKHVPSGEMNPFEHVKTNVMGSQNLTLAADAEGVQKVLGVSSDKAVEPINLYGATKLCMERIFVAMNSVGRTRFSCVRYGNVLGSRGSFLETLYKLKAEGATRFELRSKESTRFWISATEASKFVLDRLQDMEGGEIFVPRIPSSTAYQFAKEILPDAEPDIVGIPTGEKIHETLISDGESRYTEELESLFVIRTRGEPNGRTFRYTSRDQLVEEVS